MYWLWLYWVKKSLRRRDMRMASWSFTVTSSSLAPLGMGSLLPSLRETSIKKQDRPLRAMVRTVIRAESMKPGKVQK